jgi:hypothetical protein
MSIGYSDAPVPTNPAADFANWRKNVDEMIDRLARTKHSRFVVTVTDTPDGSGYLVFDHNAGEVPQAVIIQPQAPSAGAGLFSQAICDTYTETTARVRCLGNTGSALTTSVTFKAYIIV